MSEAVPHALYAPSASLFLQTTLPRSNLLQSLHIATIGYCEKLFISRPAFALYVLLVSLHFKLNAEATLLAPGGRNIPTTLHEAEPRNFTHGLHEQKHSKVERCGELYSLIDNRK